MSEASERILIELKTKPPLANIFEHPAQRFRAVFDPQARVLLITPDEPNRFQVERFDFVFKYLLGEAELKALNDQPTFLGKPSPGSWTSLQTWSALQTNSLINGFESYRSALIGLSPYSVKPPPGEMEELARQFPSEAIARFQESDDSLEFQLSLGVRRENVTIVLSEIVNFFNLVTASCPEDLKEAMGQYYQQASQAVLDHGGTHDKFIGDPVMAVLGYRHAKPKASCYATRFANVLASIGCTVRSSWQTELNAAIVTGTRIGIATGVIWPINIDRLGIGVTLLADTIDLAARLEKNCPVDSLLIDNITHASAVRAEEDRVASLDSKQLVIPSTDVKEHGFPILAWALS